jgi:hypothetical protein
MNSKSILVVLVAMFALSGLSARFAFAQTAPVDETNQTLPIGLAIRAQMEELHDQRLQRIDDLIVEFKLNNTEKHQDKLLLISQFHQMIQARVIEWQQQFRTLVQKLGNGSITPTEFRMERERLRYDMFELNGTFVHLVQWLQETLKGSKGEEEKLGQQISSLNKEVADQMSGLHQELHTNVKGIDDQGKGKGKSEGKP